MWRLITYASVVSGICPSGSTEAAGDQSKVVCLPKKMADLWVKMASKGNNPDSQEFLRYRSAVLKATKKPAKDCSFDVRSDAYLGPESKLSDVAEALLNGERPKERPDFRSWEKHAFLVESCQHVCKDHEVPIGLTTRMETFYNKRNLKERALQECNVFLAGYLNFYAPHFCVHERNPDMIVGIEDKTGVCMRIGSEVDANGTAVRRSGDWYQAPTCIAVREPGNELNPYLQDCQCCGDFEFNIQQTGVVLYAEAPKPPKITDEIQTSTPEEMIYQKACCFVTATHRNVERSTDNRQMKKNCEHAQVFMENKEECRVNGVPVDQNKIDEEQKKKMVCGKFCQTRDLKVTKGVNLLKDKDVCEVKLDAFMCQQNKGPQSNIPNEKERVMTLINGRAVSPAHKTVICLSHLMNK